jgi:electron transport complex protein RnfG
VNGLQVAAPPSVWKMYRAMVGVGLLCGLLIVTVFLVTGPVIERNKAEALQRAIFRVLPEARSSATFRLDGDGFAPLVGKGEPDELVYAGYAADGRLVGLAVEAQGMGYQDVIHLLYGYSYEQDAIVGVQVLESKETPGLGDRIESDEEFLKNFERLDVSLNDARSELAHPIAFAKHGQKTEPWQVDGITGATISSRAITDILNRSAAYWIPRIRRGLDDFRKAG